MVKLTPDLIHKSMQYTNPVKDRELDLRGFKIPVIENLGATLDQFDTIDFSDNDIHKLGGFPLLKRLKHLLLNNNRIVRIAEGLEECLPNLESIILTGNLIQELGDIDVLAKLPHLRYLSLLYNPVQSKPHYRQYIAYKLPQLKVLDFNKIKQKEREEAINLFKSKKGKELQKEISKAKTFVPGAGLPAPKTGPTQVELWKIREAVSKAATLEEVERLNRLLQQAGVGRNQLGRQDDDADDDDDDDDDDDGGGEGEEEYGDEYKMGEEEDENDDNTMGEENEGNDEDDDYDNEGDSRNNGENDEDDGEGEERSVGNDDTRDGEDEDDYEDQDEEMDVEASNGQI